MPKQNIPNFTEVRAVTTSKHGYPLFDFFVPRGSGYVGASGIAFYSENESLVNEFSELCDDIDNRDFKDKTKFQNFFNKHPDTLVEYNEISRTIGVMDQGESLAFGHLTGEKSRKETLKAGYYGALHLIIEEEVLIFRDKPLIQGDLNEPKNFTATQEALQKKYQEGKIKPEVIFKGIAARQIIDSLGATPVYKMTPHAKELHAILEEFSNVIGNYTKVAMLSEKKLDSFVLMTQDNEPIIIEHATPKKYIVWQNNNEEKETVIKEYTNLADTLKDIVDKITENKIQKFLKRKKI